MTVNLEAGSSRSTDGSLLDPKIIASTVTDSKGKFDFDFTTTPDMAHYQVAMVVDSPYIAAWGTFHAVGHGGTYSVRFAVDSYFVAELRIVSDENTFSPSINVIKSIPALTLWSVTIGKQNRDTTVQMRTLRHRVPTFALQAIDVTRPVSERVRTIGAKAEMTSPDSSSYILRIRDPSTWW